MRLFNIRTRTFSLFYTYVPTYIILSHRWKEGTETSYQDVQKQRNTSKDGYKKLEGFAEYVRTHVPHVEWIWMDTCCINQRDAAELSEAVNSMFEWYHNAELCVAYLEGVEAADDKSGFVRSEWFKRGWTLQELLAPLTVVFVTREWQVIGSKGSLDCDKAVTFTGPRLEKDIARITGISEQVLHDFKTSSSLSVDQRLRWMEGRSTTREEDMSYALYGIFDVALGANYGEKREKARERLLEAIKDQGKRTAQSKSLPDTWPSFIWRPFIRDPDGVWRPILLCLSIAIGIMLALGFGFVYHSHNTNKTLLIAIGIMFALGFGFVYRSHNTNNTQSLNHNYVSIANQGGKPTDYVQVGSNHRQINGPRIYYEGSSTHTYYNNYVVPEDFSANGSTTLERLETAPKPSSNVPFRRDPHFIARPNLTDQTRAKLEVPGGRTALAGLGGVGKSQLAIEYARELRQRSPQTWVLWIHASNAARFEKSVRDIADLLKLYGRKDPKADVLQLLRDWLRDESKGSWMIVLDNADDAGFLLEPLATTGETQTTQRRIDYLPSCEHGSMLITTRSKSEALKLVYDSEIVDVLRMSEDEAEALLVSKLERQSPDDRPLVRALDCMPLAITQAAAYIRERGLLCSVQQYREEIEKSRESRISLLRRHIPLPNRDAEASNAVMLTWRISFEHLYKTQKSAAELLSLMSFCDRVAIPQILIHADTGDTKPPVSSSAFEDDITTLRSFSFVSETADVQVWEMHTLVQDATQAWLEDRGRRF